MFRLFTRGIKLIIISIYRLIASINNWLILLGNNVDLGSNVRINGPIRCDVKPSGKMIISSDTKINSGQLFNPIGRNQISYFRVGHGALLEIGSNVGMSSVTIICSKEVIIRDNVKIGGNTVIYDTDFHSLNRILRLNQDFDLINAASRSILIEDGAFIGAHCIILKGSKIGLNSVIGAGSVVSGRVPANEIWAGNPARYIKSL